MLEQEFRKVLGEYFSVCLNVLSPRSGSIIRGGFKMAPAEYESQWTLDVPANTLYAFLIFYACSHPAQRTNCGDLRIHVFNCFWSKYSSQKRIAK